MIPTAGSSEVPSASAIEMAIFTLLNKRSLSSSICPSEVAKALVGRTGDWRSLMQPVRDVARILLNEKRLRVTQGDNELSGDQAWVGAIRLRLPHQTKP